MANYFNYFNYLNFNELFSKNVLQNLLNNSVNIANYFNYFNYFNFNELFSKKVLQNLAVQPNQEKPGGPNPPTNKKKFLNKFETNLWSKYVKNFEQQMGTGHPMWHHRDAKLMKVCTIIITKIDKLRCLKIFQ